MSSPDDVETVKRETAEFLGIGLDEVEYITAESLALPVREFKELGADELPDHQEHEEAETSERDLDRVVPNRVMWINDVVRGFVPNRMGNISFWANCQRSGPKILMWDNEWSRYERDGTCGIGGGKYVYRYKLWYRA